MEFKIRINLHAAERVVAVTTETPRFDGARESIMQFPYGPGCVYPDAMTAAHAAMDAASTAQGAMRLAGAHVDGPGMVLPLLQEARDTDAEEASAPTTALLTICSADGGIEHWIHPTREAAESAFMSDLCETYTDYPGIPSAYIPGEICEWIAHHQIDLTWRIAGLGEIEVLD